MSEFESDIERGYVIVADREYECAVCRKLTKFIDVCFEAAICSKECEQKLVYEMDSYKIISQ